MPGHGGRVHRRLGRLRVGRLRLGRLRLEGVVEATGFIYAWSVCVFLRSDGRHGTSA